MSLKTCQSFNNLIWVDAGTHSLMTVSLPMELFIVNLIIIILFLFIFGGLRWCVICRFQVCICHTTFLQGCALRKIEESSVLWTCKIWVASIIIMICMKKLPFLVPWEQKPGPLSSSRAQLYPAVTQDASLHMGTNFNHPKINCLGRKQAYI